MEVRGDEDLKKFRASFQDLSLRLELRLESEASPMAQRTGFKCSPASPPQSSAPVDLPCQEYKFLRERIGCVFHTWFPVPGPATPSAICLDSHQG